MLPMFASYSAKMLGAASRSAGGNGSSIETPSAASRSRPRTFAGIFAVYSVSSSVRSRRDIPSGLSRGRGVEWGKVARTSVPRWTARSRPRCRAPSPQRLASARASPASASSSRSVTKRGCRWRSPSAKKTYADTTSSAGSLISGRTRAKNAFGMAVPAAELGKPVTLVFLSGTTVDRGRGTHNGFERISGCVRCGWPRTFSGAQCRFAMEGGCPAEDPSRRVWPPTAGVVGAQEDKCFRATSSVYPLAEGNPLRANAPPLRLTGAFAQRIR